MTRIDTPLELTSLRDDDPTPARYRPSGSTLPTRIAALLAIAAAALAAGDANSASVGPGRFVLLIVVIAWCVGALVTSVFRPAEPLAASMTLTGGTIALAMLGAAEAANHPTYDVTAVVPRDRDRRTARGRGCTWCSGSPTGGSATGRAGGGRSSSTALAVGVAIWCIAARPDIPLAGMVGMSCRRGRGRPHRLRGAVPAGPDAGRARPAAVAGMGCAHRRRDRARRGRARRARRLAEGAARRDGRRDRSWSRSRSRSARTGRWPSASTGSSSTRSPSAGSPRSSRWWRSRVVAALGRSLDGGERSVLGLSIAGAATAALALGPGARAAPGLRQPAGVRRAARARRGDPHLREPAHARAAARRAAAPARRVAEEDDGPRPRRGVDPLGRHASSARCRCPTAATPSCRSPPRRRR